MKTYLRVYLDPIQQKTVKEICEANMEHFKQCYKIAMDNEDEDVAIDFKNEYFALKYLLDTIEKGEDEVLSHVE